MTDLADVLKRLANGEMPAMLPPDCACRQELQQLIDAWAAIAIFTQSMANGDLSATLDVRGPLAGALKALQANLRHLTWQTKEVAAGDFTQRVAFLGDFSVAFNHMVESLALSRDKLTSKNQELRESEARFRNLFEQNASPMWMADAVTGEIVDVNASAVAFYGYPKDQLTRMRVAEINVGAAETIEAEMPRILNGASSAFTTRHQLASGEERIVEVHPTLVEWQGRDLVLSILIDVTRRAQAEEALRESEAQVRQLAFFDPLTQLPNRRLLDDRLKQAMTLSTRSGCYCAVMYIDLDNFKQINDAYGHGSGDQLLLEVTRRLKGSVREMDTVARLGGDEFVILIGDLYPDKAQSLKQANIIAEKIRLVLSLPYVLEIAREGEAGRNIEHHSSASIGLTLFADQQTTPDRILEAADKAMYQAKAAGRNAIRFF